MAEPSSTHARIVIGIPTYRRPATLRTLLDTLLADLRESELARERGVFVVIADNASDPLTAKIAEQHLDGIPHVAVGVSAPGVAAVRNAIGREAARACPGYEWLVMLDDDGEVIPGWLDPLLRTAKRLDVDIIGGPVLGDLPEGASRVAQNSLYGGRRRFPSGRVEMLNGAQNIAVARRVWETVPEPWFDPALRRGGEDYEFFKHAKAMGFRFGWCDEAPVDEPTPADRLTTRAICVRVFASNRSGAHVDYAYDGLASSIRRAGVIWVWAAKSVAAAVIRRDLDRLIVAGLHAVCGVGRAVGLAEAIRGRRGPAGQPAEVRSATPVPTAS